MKKRLVLLAVGMVAVTAAGPGVAEAKDKFLDAFNARYGTSATRLNSCSVCHTTVPSLNPYGKAFKTKWKSGLTVGQALGAIQPLDSDLDTFSNIKEIKARTFPGRKGSHP